MAKRQIDYLERAMRDEVECAVECLEINVSRKEVNRIAHKLVFDESNEDIWEALNIRIIEYLEH